MHFLHELDWSFSGISCKVCDLFTKRLNNNDLNKIMNYFLCRETEIIRLKLFFLNYGIFEKICGKIGKFLLKFTKFPKISEKWHKIFRNNARKTVEMVLRAFR